MILVDTSVWIDHLRSADTVLASLLEGGEVLTHPFVIGELAVGNLQPRPIVLHGLRRLPQAHVARHEEVLQFVDQEQLFGLGIGYIDAHLLASVRLTPDAGLWTRDRRLMAIAARLSMTAKMLN